MYYKKIEIFILSIENPMRSSLTTMSYLTRLIKIVRVKKKIKCVNEVLKYFKRTQPPLPNKNLLHQHDHTAISTNRPIPVPKAASFEHFAVTDPISPCHGRDFAQCFEIRPHNTKSAEDWYNVGLSHVKLMANLKYLRISWELLVVKRAEVPFIQRKKKEKKINPTFIDWIRKRIIYGNWMHMRLSTCEWIRFLEMLRRR